MEERMLRRSIEIPHHLQWSLTEIGEGRRQRMKQGGCRGVVGICEVGGIVGRGGDGESVKWRQQLGTSRRNNRDLNGWKWVWWWVWCLLDRLWTT